MATRLTTIIVSSIVVATLIAGLIVGAQRDDSNGPVDLIVVNGRVRTPDGSEPLAEAVAIRGNTILRVGANRDVLRLQRPQTLVVDAAGGAVVPGFDDAHAHFVEGALGLGQLDLTSAVTLESLQARVREHAEATSDRAWVVGRGWYHTTFPEGVPTRQMLDKLVPDRPAYLLSFDGRSAWVNSRALALAGITRKTPNPEHGVIVKDARSGEPVGVLEASARTLVGGLIPAPAREEQLRSLRAAVAEAHRLGVTSVQTTIERDEDLEMLEELRRAGDLQVRVYAVLPVEPPLAEADADRLDALRERFPDDPLLKVGAVALDLDRSADAPASPSIAWQGAPATNGDVEMTVADVESTVTSLDRRGWQILVHASSESAVRTALDAFEKASAENPEVERGRRHRIEGVDAVTQADLPRFARLNVIAATQPAHADPMLQASPAPVPAGDEPPLQWAWAAIRDAGGRLAFGSDWPTGTLDPRAGLELAISHATADANGDHTLPLAAALDAYTAGGAYASFDEHRKGTIARGMLADLAILSADIFSLPPEQLIDAQVKATIFDGKVVFSLEPVPTAAPTTTQ